MDTPNPTAVRHEWWPATVRLPNHPTPIHMCRVFATDAGLLVYTNQPTPKGEPTLHWWSPINYRETPPPSAVYGHTVAHITTDQGVVMVQKNGACGSCSFKRIRNWQPPWLGRREAWGDPQ